MSTADLDPETIKQIDAYLDTLGIDDWPLPNASQLDLLRRIFGDPGVRRARGRGVTTFDAATEAYLDRLLAAAPPLDTEQAALIVRDFARSAAPVPPPPPRPVALYRHYDVDDALLYVGITDSPAARTKSHGRHAAWAPFAVRVAMEEHPDRETALAAEREAIRLERPLFNVQHAAADRNMRVVEYLVNHGRLDLVRPGV